MKAIGRAASGIARNIAIAEVKCQTVLNTRHSLFYRPEPSDSADELRAAVAEIFEVLDPAELTE